MCLALQIWQQSSKMLHPQKIYWDIVFWQNLFKLWLIMPIWGKYIRLLNCLFNNSLTFLPHWSSEFIFTALQVPKCLKWITKIWFASQVKLQFRFYKNWMWSAKTETNKTMTKECHLNCTYWQQESTAEIKNLGCKHTFWNLLKGDKFALASFIVFSLTLQLTLLKLYELCKRQALMN